MNSGPNDTCPRRPAAAGTARLILDRPASGTWNMAVDEVLLRTTATTGQISLRIYGWSEPTLSLGYFQLYQTRCAHAASRNCPVVRRASGGGAIVHDRELTYSLAAPVGCHADRQPQNWYARLHQAWITVLAESGVSVELCPRTDPSRETRFLCFDRRAKGDLLVGPVKIGGSAQRRHHQALLQHGSLLLDRSPAAPELPGIAQLTGLRANESWSRRWAELLAPQLDVTWALGQLSPLEAELAASLRSEKFGNEKWTRRR